MASIDLWLVGKPFREGLVKKLFQANADFLSRYDVILVDTAPSTSLLTFSLMVAATNLLVVARLEPQCIETLDQMISNVQELEASGCDQFDIRIIANGVVAPSHPMSDSVESAAVALAQRFPEIIEEKVLSLSPSFVRQVDLYDPSQCGTVIEREPNSMACRQVIDLAKSLARHYKIKLGLDE
jgi:chromosome partitioning protein